MKTGAFEMLSSNSENRFVPIPPRAAEESPKPVSGTEAVPGDVVNDIFNLGNFIRALQVRARFGHLSRSPLRLLRIELRGDVVECDWMARPCDVWDHAIPRRARERHEAAQALEDAITIRDLIFSTLPAAQLATVRAYRETAENGPEMIIRGIVTRGQEAPRMVRSLAMRAKLCGLQFVLEDGVLRSSDDEICAMNF
jgi:hypothetical protein